MPELTQAHRGHDQFCQLEQVESLFSLANPALRKTFALALPLPLVF